MNVSKEPKHPWKNKVHAGLSALMGFDIFLPEPEAQPIQHVGMEFVCELSGADLSLHNAGLAFDAAIDRLAAGRQG